MYTYLYKYTYVQDFIIMNMPGIVFSVIYEFCLSNTMNKSNQAPKYINVMMLSDVSLVLSLCNVRNRNM